MKSRCKLYPYKHSIKTNDRIQRAAGEDPPFSRTTHAAPLHGMVRSSWFFGAARPSSTLDVGIIQHPRPRTKRSAQHFRRHALPTRITSTSQQRFQTIIDRALISTSNIRRSQRPDRTDDFANSISRQRTHLDQKHPPQRSISPKKRLRQPSPLSAHPSSTNNRHRSQQACRPRHRPNRITRSSTAHPLSAQLSDRTSKVTGGEE